MGGGTSKQAVGTWAEKEHRNLLRAKRAGVPVPLPLWRKAHILALEFVGEPATRLESAQPAPQLREVQRMSARGWSRAYVQVLAIVRALYADAKLVHCDLSEYNVLFFRKQCYAIDLGQAVDIGHPRAAEWLERDLDTISRFFAKRGVDVAETARAVGFVTAAAVESDADFLALLRGGAGNEADGGGGAESGDEYEWVGGGAGKNRSG